MNEKSTMLPANEEKGRTDLIDLVANFDWSKTALGERKFWPPDLQVIVNTCLHCNTAISILWGEDMIQIYNEAYSQIIGIKHPGALGAKAEETWSDIWQEIGSMLETVLREGKSVLLENHPFILDRKGYPEECYFTFSYSPIYNEEKIVKGIFVSVTETTDRDYEKKQEEKLQKFVEERTFKLQERNEQLKTSEERYHKMIDEVQDYAIILLNKDGIIQNWNKGAEKIKQYKESEAVGRHFQMFYLPVDRADKLPERLINEAIMHGRAIHEGWRLRKDGTRFWGSITLTALHDGKNNVIGFSKVTRDLTERKNAEDKMREYMLELESQNRELEQFAYVASHDLQEPLRKIQTFIEVIEKDIRNELTVGKYFEKINSSAKRMSELIQSVLNYSRLSKENDQMVDTDLNVVMANIRSDFELLIYEKNATIFSDPLPVIKAIPLQVNQLFANLISNALKFADKEPVIKISSELVTKEQMVNPPKNIAEGTYLQLVFTDNGIGFDQQYEKLIFSMFQRLHGRQEYSGTGIGLALCKKIMENHGGHIAGKGELTKGATFYVYFRVEG